MKITKLGHACLLVEMPKRTALFDPGVYSSVDIDLLEYLDDIIVTHGHGDHMDIELIRQLQEKFPEVRIKASSKATGILNNKGLQTMQDADEGVVVFDAPHAAVEPLFPDADNMGVHYIDKLTHPGDSLDFDMTKSILALPVTAPWGAAVTSFHHGVRLKPKFIIPIHDWHWRDEARKGIYDILEEKFAEHDIEFIKTIDGEPFSLDA